MGHNAGLRATQDAIEAGALLIGYGSPGCDDLLNRIIFSTPVLSLGEGPKCRTDCIVLLVEPLSISIREPGLYLENGLVKEDFIADFECFWKPLKRALIARLIAGESGREYGSLARL